MNVCIYHNHNIKINACFINIILISSSKSGNDRTIVKKTANNFYLTVHIVPCTEQLKSICIHFKNYPAIKAKKVKDISMN